MDPEYLLCDTIDANIVVAWGLLDLGAFEDDLFLGRAAHNACLVVVDRVLPAHQLLHVEVALSHVVVRVVTHHPSLRQSAQISLVVRREFAHSCGGVAQLVLTVALLLGRGRLL